MRWTTEDRLRVVEGLDRVNQFVTRLYRWLITAVIAAILLGTAWVIWTKPFGKGVQGEWFYFGVFVLLALGWAVKQLAWAGRRERHRWSDEHGEALGGLFRFSTTRSVTTPLATLEGDALPHDDVLSEIERQLAAGADLDDVCHRLIPAYVNWNEMERQAIRLYVTYMLEKRGNLVRQ